MAGLKQEIRSEQLNKDQMDKVASILQEGQEAQRTGASRKHSAVRRGRAKPNVTDHAEEAAIPVEAAPSERSQPGDRRERATLSQSNAPQNRAGAAANLDQGQQRQAVEEQHLSLGPEAGLAVTGREPDSSSRGSQRSRQRSNRKLAHPGPQRPEKAGVPSASDAAESKEQGQRRAISQDAGASLAADPQKPKKARQKPKPRRAQRDPGNSQQVAVEMSTNDTLTSGFEDLSERPALLHAPPGISRQAGNVSKGPTVQVSYSSPPVPSLRPAATKSGQLRQHTRREGQAELEQPVLDTNKHAGRQASEMKSAGWLLFSRVCQASAGIGCSGVGETILQRCLKTII